MTVDGNNYDALSTDIDGGTLNLDGTSASTPTLTLNGGTLTQTGTLMVTGTADFNTGTENGGGTVIVQGGATFFGSNEDELFTLSGQTLELFGTSNTATGPGSVGDASEALSLATASSELVIESGATFTDSTGQSGNNGFNITGSGVVDNEGMWNRSGPNSSTISTTFNNTGTVSVGSGSQLVLSGNGTDVGATYEGAGTVNFGGGTRTLDSASSITANASFTGGTVTDSGSYNAPSTNVGGGTANLAGTVGGLGATTITSGTLNIGSNSTTATSLTQSGGTLTGTGALTVTGTADFNTGTENGGGTVIVQGGATFFGSNEDELFTLSGQTLELFGTSNTSTGPGSVGDASEALSLATTSSELVIESGATFTDSTGQSGNNGFNITGSGVVDNEGMWDRSGPNSSTISTTFNNTGTVSVGSGSALDLTGGGTDAGATYEGAGTVEFGGGTRTFSGNSVIESATLINNSPIVVDGGTLQITPAVTGSGSFAMSGNAILEFSGVEAQAITLSSTGNTIDVAQLASFTAAVGGFGASDVLDLNNVAYASSEYAIWTQTSTSGSGSGTLQIYNGPMLEGTLNLTGTYGPGNFALTTDSGTGTELIWSPTTVILTGLNGGNAEQGDTVTVSLGATNLGTVTYTWLLNGQIVAGDNTNSYTPALADQGKTLDVVASFADPNTGHTDLVTGVAGTVQTNLNYDDWNGTGNWTTNTSDWSSGAPPNSTQIASLDSGTVTFSSSTVTVAELISTSTATLDVSGGILTVTDYAGQGSLGLSGGTLNVGSSSANVASLTELGGTLTGAGTLTVTGTATFAAASSTENGGGTTVLAGGASIATGGNNFSLTLSLTDPGA